MPESTRRLRPPTQNTEDIDENSLRDKEIRQLQKAVDMAYTMLQDSKIDLKTRQGWFEKYTSAALALNQVLKDRQDRDWERRLKELEEFRKNIKRNIEQRSIEQPETSAGSTATPA